MRRRLLTGTLGIALSCVVLLGLPLALLARHEVWTSARDRINEQAADVAVALEDRIETKQPIDLGHLVSRLPGRQIVVATPSGTRVIGGVTISGGAISGQATVLDYTVTVRAAKGPTTTRAREVTVIVIGLALAAAGAAIALALWQARRLATPVARLLDRADDLGRGDFAAPPLTSGIPEIDALSAGLDRSARQIGAYVELQRDFAADAAHQLRTPLTSVALHLDEIAAVGDDAVRREAEEALAQVERLDGVITSFLARARGDSEPPAELDLSALVAGACSPWSRLLSRQGRALQRDIAQGVLVLARRDHLLAVLSSLLENALAHGAGTVTVSVTSDGERASLSVADQGAGVPNELVGSIFERRISGNRGTGIGLGLARSLMAAEGGTLRLDVGSRFVATLPLRSERGEHLVRPGS